MTDMHNGDDTLQQMRDDLASDLSRERYIAERDAGNYEIRQGPYALVASGTCAACLGRVKVLNTITQSDIDKLNTIAAVLPMGRNDDGYVAHPAATFLRAIAAKLAALLPGEG